MHLAGIYLCKTALRYLSFFLRIFVCSNSLIFALCLCLPSVSLGLFLSLSLSLSLSLVGSHIHPPDHSHAPPSLQLSNETASLPSRLSLTPTLTIILHCKLGGGINHASSAASTSARAKHPINLTADWL